MTIEDKNKIDMITMTKEGIHHSKSDIDYNRSFQLGS